MRHEIAAAPVEAPRDDSMGHCEEHARRSNLFANVNELLTKSALDLLALIRRHEISPVELVQASRRQTSPLFLPPVHTAT